MTRTARKHTLASGAASFARRSACTLLALLLALPCAMFAQEKSASSDVINYQGRDRERRLLEGARKEGGLSLYTSMVNKDIEQLAGAFQKKYGIKVTYWRGSAQKVLQRTVTEARGARREVDVVQAPALVMEALHQEKLLQPIRSPLIRDLMLSALPAHGDWVGLRVYVFVQAYNTRKVSKDELPGAFGDLRDPRWKGRLGAEAKGQEWFRAVLQVMGEEKGLKLFRELVATNGVSVRSGNSLLNNLVISGEVPFALSVYSYLPEKAKAAGAPIDYIALQPTIAYSDGMGVATRPPHPHAAALFFDFMLSDGLRLMREQQQLTTHQRDAAALDRFKPTMIDPARMLVDYDRWSQLYQDTIAGRAPSAMPSRAKAGQ